MGLTVWTMGHSVRPIDELLAVLAVYDIELVADVRRFPGSRRLPQYAAPALEESLVARDLGWGSVRPIGQARERPFPRPGGGPRR